MSLVVGVGEGGGGGGDGEGGGGVVEDWLVVVDVADGGVEGYGDIEVPGLKQGDEHVFDGGVVGVGSIVGELSYD